MFYKYVVDFCIGTKSCDDRNLTKNENVLKAMYGLYSYINKRFGKFKLECFLQRPLLRCSMHTICIQRCSSLDYLPLRRKIGVQTFYITHLGQLLDEIVFSFSMLWELLEPAGEIMIKMQV